MSLTEYKRKRHFDRTPEPTGTGPKAAKSKAAKTKTTPGKTAGRKTNGKPASSKSLSFVVQKHAASRLHYDLRLELDGVLKSWAVPKGPSFDPHEKRLAVEVEDHPIDYADFEGIIPEGEYGGGTVAVWDRGAWLPDGDPHAGIRTGKLKFHLDGEKLRGGWTLVRMARRERDRATNWLLIKERDDDARPLDEYDVEQAAPASVVSGRTIDEIAQDQDRVWGSNRPAKNESRTTNAPAGRATKKSSIAKRAKPRKAAKAKPRRATAKNAARRKPPAGRGGKKSTDEPAAGSHSPAIPAGARRAKMPGAVKMQLATLAKTPPEGERWLHEIKFDGYRIICRLQGGRAQLITRGGQDWTGRMPDVARTAERLPVNDAILDGEVVALLPSGVSSFQALQNAFRGSRTEPLIYYVFDLLYLDGHDLQGLPLDERKKLLAEVLETGRPSQRGRAAAGTIRYTEHVVGEGAHFFSEACRLGLEGSISKRRDRAYSPGRSYDWLKIKCVSREEFVIGGFTDPEGARRGLGSLLVGFYRGGKLIYAGHVGTGFSDRMLLDLRRRLDRLAQSRSPFADFPLRSTPRGTHWVEPQLVGQVEFSNWTDDGRLRHPSFQGLREDKPANTVTRDDPRDLAELDANDAAASNGRANRNGATMAKKAAKHNAAKHPHTKRKPAKRKTADRTSVQKATGNGAPTNVAKPAAAQRAQAAARDLHEVAGVRLTHPDRVVYPEQGITKLGLASFYVQIADWILPHVIDRPLSLLRCPTGRGQACFYQKHIDASAPAALGRVTIQEKDTSGVYSVVRDVAGLVALVQMGVLEIHPWGSRADDVERPDRLTIDLDPSGEVGWPAVAEGARRVRKLLRSVGLESFVKTSGGKGLHVVAPIQRRLAWPELKAFCKAIAQRMATDSPDEFTTSPLKAARKHKTFVDYLRNERGATSVAAYSTRARQGAPVSTPVGWDELDSDLRSDYFNVENLPARLKKLRRDPWRELGGMRQSITASARKTLGIKS